MLFCLSFRKRCSFIWDMVFSLFGEQEQMCYVAIVSDSSFVQMKQSIHLVNPWTQWLPLCTSWKIYSISGPWIYIPQTFWYNGIVLGPSRASIWLCKSVDGFPTMWACAFLNVLTWSSSLRSSLTYMWEEILLNDHLWEKLLMDLGLGIKCGQLIFSFRLGCF